MRIIFRYAILFMGGSLCAIAWSDVLAKAVNYEDAWVTVSVFWGFFSAGLCINHFKKIPDTVGAMR